jgi:alpha-D-xyloside xylohydrolase
LISTADGSVRVRDLQDHPILSETWGGTWFSATQVGKSPVETLASGQKFVLDSEEGIYGLGQHPEKGSMDYVGNCVQLRQENTKVAIPVLLSSKGYALLWDNPAITAVDIGKTDKGTISWFSDAGFGVDYYVMAGPTPNEAIAQYRWLSGTAPLFGKWVWGFWQSRERYKSQEEILGVVSEYRKRGIPFDGIVQDWQYWPPLNRETAGGGWGSHEFDPSRYPDPVAMIKGVHDQNAHLLISVWPKFDVTDKKVSIPDLRELEAVGGAYDRVIPFVYPVGQGKWYDPFNDKARSVYWGQISKKLFNLGVDAWWLDASEAELSGNWGEFNDFKTGKGPGALVYNAYPLEHTRAVYEGQRAENPDKRVMILTRSAYAGQQRYGSITWSGDITARWEIFRNQIPAGLNFTASGIPYWNTDIGGFFGNHPKDPKFVELFTRWFEFGAFCPMFRVHGTDDPKEVWRFDEPTQAILKDFINLRYHLIPYIYSVSWMVTHDGYTMMRPLVMDFPGDAQARKVPDQFLFGPSLMVSPVTAPGVQGRPVVLPSGCKWTDFWTGTSFEGGTTLQAEAPIGTMPIHVRAGSILPYGPSIQYATEKPGDPIELRVYPGGDGDFTLYDDQNDGYGYEKGLCSTIPLHWDDAKQTLTLGERQGQYPGMPARRIFRIVRVGSGHGSGLQLSEHPNAEVNYNGKKAEVTLSATR